MMKITFSVKIPVFIERVVLFFLLRWRKRYYGIAFRRIKLTKGKYALVSPEDYGRIGRYDWVVYEKENQHCYAARLADVIVPMHREVMMDSLFDSVQQESPQAAQSKAGKVVHHIDGEGLNNTRENLQIVTAAENHRYYRKRKMSTSSKYKGVSLEKGTGKWRARIIYEGQYEHLGYFETEEEAGRAYDMAIKKYHGEYAVLNFEAKDAI